MAKRKDLETLSSDELFALAQKRAKEEDMRKREESRAELALLRDERRKLISAHNRQLSMLDAKILMLGGRSGMGKKSAGRTGTSAAILSLLSNGQLDTKTIRSKLESQSIAVGNLAQTMAYLKRTGRVVAVGRGVYQLA